MTTPNSPNSTHNIWFPCTEATNHFTADINNLNVDSLSYHSSDQVSIEDGSSLPILHTGSANLHSLQGTFLLSNLLHAPLIAKNLLLVKQFCLDNYVYFEFHVNSFFVRDSQLHRILAQGTVENGLYVLPCEVSTSSWPSSQALLCECTTPHFWHIRLGHPSHKITSLTLNQLKLPVTKVVDFT